MIVSYPSYSLKLVAITLLKESDRIFLKSRDLTIMT